MKKMKRFISLFATAALAISGLSPFATTVVHAEATQPDDTQFADSSALKMFNTNDSDGVDKAAKVYFGQKGQQWWIAGTQNEDLVLFAASPISNQTVDIANDANEKRYRSSWNCTYAASEPDYVYPAHYGGSNSRALLMKIESSYFYPNEQSLVHKSRVYTWDNYNQESYYTEDIFYLANTSINLGQRLSVGENKDGGSYNALHNGLFIDKQYLAPNVWFWLRSPPSGDKQYRYYAQAARYNPENPASSLFPTGTNQSIGNEYYLMPAFALDFPSVLFASAAQKASGEGTLSIEDVDGTGAFTLRFDAAKAGKNLGAAEVAYSNGYVTLANVPEGTYLVAQNNEGAWAKAVSGSDTVQASDMGEGFTSFENCQVWLETSEDRITYATLATKGEQKQQYAVTYEFRSGTDGQRLPAEVKNLLPASTTAEEGSTVTPADPSQTVVEVADGVWTFQGYDPERVESIGENVAFTGTWTFSKNPAVTIAPASVTIYMGGDGYEGTVGQSGTSISDNEIVARYGFPEPGFLVTLPEALEDTDVRSLCLQYRDGEETAQWTFALYGDSGNVYRITPVKGTQSRTVQVQFTDQEDNSIESLEAFDFSKYLNQTLTMKVYGPDVAQENVSILCDGRVYPVAVGEGATVTVRGTTADVRYGEVLENPGDTYAPMESGKAVPGAAVPVDTVFTINGSDVQVGADAPVSLLFDGIIDSNASADGKNYTQLLEEKVGQALADTPATEGMERTCEARYLDLVDENNGNVWVAAQDDQGKARTVTVYWPLPEGTNKNTGFTVLHFTGLHRSMAPQEITSTLTAGDYKPEVIKPLRVTDTHVVFETTGFSPFVLAWETPKTSAPPEDGEDKEDPAPGVTPAPDQNKGQDSTDAPAEQTKSDTATAVAVIPRTADESRPLLWTALVVMSGAALAALTVYRKKRSDK